VQLFYSYCHARPSNSFENSRRAKKLQESSFQQCFNLNLFVLRSAMRHGPGKQRTLGADHGRAYVQGPTLPVQVWRSLSWKPSWPNKHGGKENISNYIGKFLIGLCCCFNPFITTGISFQCILEHIRHWNTFAIHQAALHFSDKIFKNASKTSKLKASKEMWCSGYDCVQVCVLYCIVLYLHLYSASCSAHQSEALVGSCIWFICGPASVATCSHKPRLRKWSH